MHYRGFVSRWQYCIDEHSGSVRFHCVHDEIFRTAMTDTTQDTFRKNNLLLKTTVVQHLYLYTPSATRGGRFFFTTAALQVRTHSEDKDKQTTGVRLNAGPVPSIFSCYKHLMFCREHKAGVWIQLVVSSFKGRVCPRIETSHFLFAAKLVELQIGHRMG